LALTTPEIPLYGGPTKNLLVLLRLALSATTAQAQESRVAIGISGWTGFAPLTLAREAGIFKKNCLDVSTKKKR